MRKVAGWLAAAISIVIGICCVLAASYAFAPLAPSLVLLALVPLVAGVLVVWLLVRPIARRMGWPARRAATIVVAATLAPFAALAAWVASTPLPFAGPPTPDPRGVPTFVTLPTGSRLATWTLSGAGARRRTPVIFLHGGPGFYAKRRDFEMGAAFRATGFDTVYYDQAGSGASGDLPVADYTMARQVADLDALRARLGAKRMVLWGESWGAMVAARYAHAHPDRTAGAVFSSPGEYPGMGEVASDFSGVRANPEPSRPPQAMILYVLLTRAPHLAESWMDQRTARGVSTALSLSTLGQPGPRCRSAPWDSRPRPATSSTSVYALRRYMLDEFAQAPPPARRFDLPALIVRGSCEFHPEVVTRRYAEAFPRARFVRVPGAGHTLLDHEDAFVRAAEAFAREQLRTVS